MELNIGRYLLHLRIDCQCAHETKQKTNLNDNQINNRKMMMETIIAVNEFVCVLFGFHVDIMKRSCWVFNPYFSQEKSYTQTDKH